MWGALRGDLSKGSEPVFTRVSKKTTENSECLGPQARPGTEPGTSRLPVLKRRTAQPLVGPRTESFNIYALPGIRTRDIWCSFELQGFISRKIWNLQELSAAVINDDALQIHRKIVGSKRNQRQG